jgi:hypothetical protein
MATTTNYGWDTPDDTDLVKDGAAAIRTLGSSVDTTTKALNPSTTLGDVEYRSATANTNTRLGIGTSGQVLTVSGGVPAWSTPAAGGSLFSIATGTLSGSSVTISSIPASYKHLYFTVANFHTNNFAALQVRLNAITTGTYTYMYFQAGDAAIGQTSGGTKFDICGTTNSANQYHQANFYVYDYTLTNNRKVFDANFETGNAGKVSGFNSSSSNTTAAISEITILTGDASTFSAGTYTLYGVN